LDKKIKKVLDSLANIADGVEGRQA